MAIDGVNGNVGAYYPKYLEDKKKRAMNLAYAGGIATMAGAACHFVKNDLAVKHPKLLFALTAVTFLGSLLGLTGAAQTQKELDKFNQQASILNTKV